MNDLNEENIVLTNRLIALENRMCEKRVAYKMGITSYADYAEALHDFHKTYKSTKEILRW